MCNNSKRRTLIQYSTICEKANCKPTQEHKVNLDVTHINTRTTVRVLAPLWDIFVRRNNLRRLLLLRWLLQGLESDTSDSALLQKIRRICKFTSKIRECRSTSYWMNNCSIPYSSTRTVLEYIFNDNRISIRTSTRPENIHWWKP